MRGIRKDNKKLDELELTKQIVKDINKMLILVKSVELEKITVPNIPIKNLEVVIKALEKQIPKKPLVEAWSPALCPCCNAELSESIGDGYYKHYKGLKICDCGQSLDWSEVEENAV